MLRIYCLLEMCRMLCDEPEVDGSQWREYGPEEESQDDGS